MVPFFDPWPYVNMCKLCKEYPKSDKSKAPMELMECEVFLADQEWP